MQICVHTTFHTSSACHEIPWWVCELETGNIYYTWWLRRPHRAHTERWLSDPCMNYHRAWFTQPIDVSGGVSNYINGHLIKPTPNSLWSIHWVKSIHTMRHQLWTVNKLMKSQSADNLQTGKKARFAKWNYSPNTETLSTLEKLIDIKYVDFQPRL